jgi:exopolyphosphatase/guanosine-5'-triphosphate,3'-diphosphate pyrophosphatase
VVCAIGRVSRARRESADRLRATSAQIRKFYKEISSLDLEGRRRVQGIGPRRAEIIVAGAAVFLRVVENLQLPSLYYSAAGVRDGIVADLAARGVGRELVRLNRDQRRRVQELARHFGVSIPHARKVADLAVSLFEGLQPLHKLTPDHGKLLEAAAYLHDTGHYVSDTGHHKHSYYLVANSDLAGFTDAERLQIALLCRFHRKSMPAPRHSEFQALDPEARRGVTLLTPLLRVADSLDRSHDQRVDSIECRLNDGVAQIDLESAVDTDLEVWAAERAADAFRQVYSCELVLSKSRR